MSLLCTAKVKTVFFSIFNSLFLFRAITRLVFKKPKEIKKGQPNVLKLLLCARFGEGTNHNGLLYARKKKRKKTEVYDAWGLSIF